MATRSAITSLAISSAGTLRISSSRASEAPQSTGEELVTVCPLGKFHWMPPDTHAPRMPMRAHFSAWLW